MEEIMDIQQRHHTKADQEKWTMEPSSGVGKRLVSERSLLYKAVTDVNENIKMFRTVLHDLKFTLDTMELFVEGNVDDISDQLERFIKEMNDGLQLVSKYSKLGAWNICKKYMYIKKLAAVDESLQNLVEMLKNQATKNAAKFWNPVKVAEDTMIEEMTNNWNNKPEHPYYTVGLEDPLQEVRKMLLSEYRSVLVLAGSGGCGKTTLATAIYFDSKIRKIFGDRIFFITVGNIPSSTATSTLQQLYQRMSSAAGTSSQDEVSEGKHTLISQERWNALLILDDVWPQTESLIETTFLNGKEKCLNYKILVTSRCQLFPQLSSLYHISSLNSENSMALLLHSAFPGGMRINVPNHLLRQVVNHCKGHPLAIITAGKSLRGMPIESWRNTLFKWSNGYQTLDHEMVNNVLRLSLQVLDNKLRECFLDFALFPEDQAIHAPAIFDIWAQRYDLCLDSMSYENLYALATRNLVDFVVRRKVDVMDEEDYSEYFVTQHDLLRSLAVDEVRNDPELSKRLNIDIRGDTVPRWWTGVEEQIKKPTQVFFLSISTDEFFTKWPIMKVPVAEVVLLNCRTKNYELPKFIRDMRKSLKVLILHSYKSANAEISRFDRLSSLSNLKTIRFYGITVSSLTKHHVYLKNLQKISFHMCNIRQAFGKVTGRISRAFPNVVELNISYCRDLVELQDDICNLVHLKKLRITDCHKLSTLPEELGKLTNLEVLCLRSCSDLEELPSSISNLKELKYLDISHCFSIKKLPENFGALKCLRNLNMMDCSRLQELPESVRNLDALKDVICDEYTQELWEPFRLIISTEIRVEKEQFSLDWLHA